MEAPAKKFGRLVAVLDDLVTQEAAHVAAADFVAVADIQRRAEPVVAAIVGCGQEVLDAMARARIASLLSRRQQNIDLIESQLATTREELDAVHRSTSRAARIAPAYARAGVMGREIQFQAAG